MQNDQNAGWQYTDGNNPNQTDPDQAPEGGSITWTASEFIAHEKSGGWYILLGLATVVVAVLGYIMTRGDKLTTVVVVLAGILFGFMAARKPRELPYTISSRGIKIGEKSYPFGTFKSFALVKEENVEAIWLLPLQRYSPGLSIYFSPTDKDKILQILDDYLPVEDRQPDFIDRLMHKVRF